MSFQLYQKPVPGFNSKAQAMKQQPIASTTKNHIRLSQALVKEIGNPDRVHLYSNDKEWAIGPAASSDKAAYKLEETGQINAESFIRNLALPVGYLFKGTLKDGMLVFSKTPFEKN